MTKTRWTLGVVLAAAVSLWGLVEADASPFSSYILSDDIGNSVRGSAPEAAEWEDESDGTDSGGAADSGDSGSGDSGSGDSGSGDSGGKSNNGHGNNADGVDSSNPSNGKGGPNGEADASCDGTGACVDDEIKGGSSDTGSETTTTVETETKTNNGKAKGKNK